MARPLRIEYPDADYHVTCRGNARQDIFLSSCDRRLFLTALEKSANIFSINILAYVLMDNHFHLPDALIQGATCACPATNGYIAGTTHR